MSTTFHAYLRQLRSEREIGLRELCTVGKVDPSNYSKYERAILAPPGDEVLRRIARGLKISTKSPEYRRLKDLARARNGEWPSELMTDERLVAALPAFYQHLRDHGLPGNKDPVDALVDALRKEL